MLASLWKTPFDTIIFEWVYANVRNSLILVYIYVFVFYVYCSIHINTKLLFLYLNILFLV